MNPYGPQQLASAIRTVRKNTIIVAEDIPEESYGYRVTPDSRSVAETLLHIATAPQIDYYMHGSDRISSIEDFQLWGDFVERIPQSQADELVTMPNGAPSKSRFEMMQGTKEHECTTARSSWSSSASSASSRT